MHLSFHTVSILAQDDGGGGGGIIQLLILLLIPVAMYFLLVRPQRKRMKDQAALQAALGVGDEVVTTSGLYGFITGEDDNLFWLEIDDDVQIRVAKAAIQGRVNTKDDASETDASSEIAASADDSTAAEDDES